MQAGQFFELDNTSSLHKGEVIFRYTKVQAENTRPTYPIYLSFKPASIDFYFHGYFKSNEETFEFIETNILSLPLYNQGTIINELSKALKSVYREEFPKENSFKVEGKTNGARNKYPAYSKLSVFNPDASEKEIQHLNLRVLLLDFLFDLQHTDLFKASPYYDKVNQLLRGNLFFEALAAKAKFYYYIENTDKKGNGKLPFGFNCNNNFNNEYRKAREKWVEIIQNPGSDKVIDGKAKRNKSNDWFENIEVELLQILQLELKKGKKKSAFKTENKKISIWFVERYNLIKAFLSILDLNFFIGFLVLSLLGSIAFYCFKEKGDYPVLSTINNFILIFFTLTFVFILIKSKGSIKFTFQFIIFNLIIILFSSWIFVFDLDIVRNRLFDYQFHLPDSLIIVLFLFALSIVLMYGSEREVRPTAKTSISIRKAIILTFLAFFYAFNISLISTHFFASGRLSKDKFLENYWFNTIVSDNEEKMPRVNKKESANLDTIYMLIEKENINDISLRNNELLNKSLANRKVKILYNNLSNLYIPSTKCKIRTKMNWLWWQFDVFFSLTVFNTFISLFIGIFIQILINRKPFTG